MTNQRNESDADLATRSQELADRIKPILAGQGSAVQSAALAELVSLWLAGHVILEEANATEKPQTEATREAILANFIALVRNLTPVNEAMILERVNAARGKRGKLQTQ